MKIPVFSLLCALPLAAQAAPKLIYPQYQDLVVKHSAAQRLDPNFVWSVMWQESGGNSRAISHKNARGLMQVIPPTAARMGVNPKLLYSPEHNIIAGTRYLRFLCNRYPDASHPTGCNIDKVLAGYNAGEGAVDKYRGIPPYRETRNYVTRIKQRYALFGGMAGAVPAGSGVVKVAAKTSSRAVARRIGNTDSVVRPARTVQLATVASKQPAAWDVFGEF